MKVTNYTCALIWNGVIYSFKRSHRKTGCDECDLGRRCRDYTGSCSCEKLCRMFKMAWNTYEHGVFKITSE